LKVIEESSDLTELDEIDEKDKDDPGESEDDSTLANYDELDIYHF